jgi:hypothetical protein
MIQTSTGGVSKRPGSTILDTAVFKTARDTVLSHIMVLLLRQKTMKGSGSIPLYVSASAFFNSTRWTERQFQCDFEKWIRTCTSRCVSMATLGDL